MVTKFIIHDVLSNSFLNDDFGWTNFMWAGYLFDSFKKAESKIEEFLKDDSNSIYRIIEVYVKE